jgi:tetratricopeptide (TPR) repeat protein
VWLFRLAAAWVLPLVGLGGLEAALRLAGYGHPTRFFLSRQVDGQEVLVENDKFGLRFFPPSMARSPAPIRLTARKAADTYRVFVFGESAALGDPRPAYGVARYLEALLEERFPGTQFEVVCVAMTAINSHGILPIARECARLGADAWIVYMGNNEMAGPFGANTVFGPQAPPWRLVRASLALQTTRTGQWLAAVVRQLRGQDAAPQVWTGLRMFLQSQIPPDDRRREIVHGNFQRNLEDIVRAGTRSGARVLLSTVAGNLKDCPPFASLHGSSFRQTDQADWTRLITNGARSEGEGKFGEALRAFEQASRIDPHFAELQFRVGHCLVGLTNFSQARRAFALARDYDALPFRADSKLNDIIIQTGQRFASRGVEALDAEAALARLPGGGQARHTPEGIPGSDLFYEHVHLTFAGNYWLARAFAEKLAPNLPEAARARARLAGRGQGQPEWAAPEACEQRLGLTDWNRRAVLENVLQRLADAPFTQQLNHAARLKALGQQLAELTPRLHPRGYMDARVLYTEALKQHADDFRLHENFGEFLEAAGHLAEATAQWERVRELIPHHFAAYFHVGRLLARQRKYDAAESLLRQALRRRPDLAEAHVQLGKILAARGQPDRALVEYELARRRQPDDPQLHMAIADALAAQGKRSEAVLSLREAIRLRPGYWEARYLLAVELASNGQVPQAQAQFEEVLRLRPDYALAHLNLGVALARQLRLDQALEQFQETLRLDPGNQKAQEHIETIQNLRRRPR